MMGLKTLVTRSLEKKSVFAKIRADLRASVFEAIEEEVRVMVKEGLPTALLGNCNDRRLLTALACECLDWAQLNHSSKAYQPESNLKKDSWKGELKEFSSKNAYDISWSSDGGPLLLHVLKGFLKASHEWSIGRMFSVTLWQSLTKSRGSGGRASERDSIPLEPRNIRRPSPCVAGGLSELGRTGAGSQVSDGRAGFSSSSSNYRKDEYNSWRYDNEELPDDCSGVNCP